MPFAAPRQSLRVLLPLVLVALAPLAPRAAGQESRETLPTVEAVMNRFIEVTGGKAAHEAVVTRLQRIDLEVVGMGMKGTGTVTAARPDKFYMVMEITGVTKQEVGHDGKVLWSKDLMNGARLLEGEERDSTLREASLDFPLNWKTAFAKHDVAGSAEVSEKPCWKLVMTPATGSPETWYFEKESGLQVRVERTVMAPQGKFKVVSTHSDWRSAGDIKLPFRTHIDQGVAQLDLKVTSVEHGTAVPAETFELPAEIKEIVKKKEAESRPAR